MSYAYFDRIHEILREVEDTETHQIQAAVNHLAEGCIHGKSLYVFGASHAGILSEELFYRAGGLMLVNPIFAPELMLNNSPVTQTTQMEQLEGYGTILARKVCFQTGDSLIVHSVSGRNPVSIDLVLEAKKSGVHVICLTNLTYSRSVSSRHSSGKKLYELADIVIDNHGDIGDAAILMPKLQQKVAPTSTVVGAAILNTIVSEVALKLIASGISKPPVFYSANLDGGSDLNSELSQYYQHQIHYKM